MVRLDVAAGHTPLDTIHSSVLVPVLKPETCVVGFAEAATVPVPATTDHSPVPTVGFTAARLAVSAQTVWLDPALAVGCASRVTVTLDVAGVHTPLLTVHRKELVPIDNPVTCDEKLAALINVAVPARADQLPDPTVGLTADKVAEVAQIVWLLPALAVGWA